MRTERFTFICSTIEREAITLLAKFYNRTQSDVIRQLILQAMHNLPHLYHAEEQMPLSDYAETNSTNKAEEK